MQGNDNRVMAMYDVRGIQDYIFRTAKLKEAVGASAIVENIITDALKNAVEKQGDLDFDLEWCNDESPLHYDSSENSDVKVLYIGGGNAYVMYSSRTLAVDISKSMALYTMEHTYSLQLATAIIGTTNNYAADYSRLMIEMTRVKDDMITSKPKGALPIMKTEVKTGYPMGQEGVSEEARLKGKAGIAVREKLGMDEKQFDSYVFEKGEDSMLAVVHIDGNNMGLRIRELIQDIENYDEAINRMRQISFRINKSYKDVFAQMQQKFNSIRRKNKWNVMKVVTSGDDITYVCNAGIALATVEYFVREISKHTMYDDIADSHKFMFSVCAGIAYFGSHFPFHIAYSVAEECCDNAKDRAKEEKNKDGEMIGNWLDFQFCRNVKAMDLERVRKEEYLTARGENLLRRPYYVSSKGLDKGLEHSYKKFRDINDDPAVSYSVFMDDMKCFILEEGNTPRSFIKELRNTYPLGEEQVSLLEQFLKSRGRNLPELYFDGDDGRRTARLYDALEVVDYFKPLDDIFEEVEG